MINRLRMKFKTFMARWGVLVLKVYIVIPFLLGWITGRLWGLARITKESTAEGFNQGNKIEVTDG